MKKKHTVSIVLLALLTLAVAWAVPTGHCPGLKKLIETADAIVILRIDRHLSDFARASQP